MASKLGHDMKKRTEDVLTVEDIDFPGMLLPESILSGLSSNGFKKPSPIQLKAIPLGRCGFDLILEAKSGTGKTCVFSIIALEMVSVERKKLQVLILVPTREIALQVTDVIRCIGSGIVGLRVHSFIGGTSFEEDKKKLQACHIAVGAPGRVRHLMEKGFMKAERIRLCVLDEADKLMEPSFIKDIKYFFSVLPTSKQVIVASATMPDELDNILNHHMKSPVRVCPHGEGVAPILFGLRQVAVRVPEHPNSQQQLNIKVYALTKLLSSVSFQQCIVFSNYLTRAEGICHELERRGWPCKHTAGMLDQSERMEAFNALIESRCRVLLSTDLTARGVDAPRVDLVVSLDLPNNGATYLHRIGRAGRFGSYGLAVTLVAAGTEMCKFSQMLRSIGASASVLTPEEFPGNLWNCDLKQYEYVGTLQNHAEKVEEDTDGLSKETENKYPDPVGESPTSESLKLKVVCRNNFAEDDVNNAGNQSGSLMDLADIDVLSNVLAHVECGQDSINSLQDLVESCESYTGENANIPEKEEGTCRYDFGASFDRVLERINSKSAEQFTERLEKCKLADLESALQKLLLGEVWPEVPVTKTGLKENLCTSWNMKDCDISLFEKPPKKNQEAKMKISDSKNGGRPRKIKNEKHRSHSDSKGSIVSNDVSESDDSSFSCDLPLCENSFISDGEEINAGRNARHSSYGGFFSSYDRRDVSSIHYFNQWYQQVIFNRCLIEYDEYWKYMFRK